MYNSISLNGTWDMDYIQEKYSLTDLPQCNYTKIENAVPGYWEDMKPVFEQKNFSAPLKINPEYVNQRYPLTKGPLDMTLPNILGNFFYRKVFSCEYDSRDAVLYFEGVQNSVLVWINGKYIGKHEGYSTEFTFEIAKEMLIKGDNEIVLSISNHYLDGYMNEPVVGLTNRAVNECTGGITGKVELRFYNSPLRDVYLKVSEDCSRVDVEAIATQSVEFSWEIYDGDDLLKKGEAKDKFSFDTQKMQRWSPEEPKLYTLKIICGCCELSRSFGIRRLVADGVHFRLNGYPYFLRGICEHCYYPDTIHPDHNKDYYKFVINKIKELGFNFIRFHTYVPEEEYLQAADELGCLVQVESPNNATVEEWNEIIRFCRRHPSVVIYCCGNELMIDEPFIEHLEKCSAVVHENTDSLFSPMSALRGLEYLTETPLDKSHLCAEPFEHNTKRFEEVGKFTDLYNSYTLGKHSYFSTTADPKENDEWSSVYNKPRVSHEICIDGTYSDLSVKDRYEGNRIGQTEMFSSIEAHLTEKGLLDRAPLYFKNSCEWQRRNRKYCFESLRLSENMAGYDFLGPIDTHWHTFGYDVGMMNEFYELKPGESVKNVLMYNSETVLLTDLGKYVNYQSGEELSFNVFTSCYNKEPVNKAKLTISLFCENKPYANEIIEIDEIENGKVSKLCSFKSLLPDVNVAQEIKLHITLESSKVFAENEWELYLFPQARNVDESGIVVSQGMTAEQLLDKMSAGEDMVLLGANPFKSLKTDFRIALAGRIEGNLATVIEKHPIMDSLPHKGFCGVQFTRLLENGDAVSFECENVPFEPIVEMVSTHKFIIKQAMMFEFNVLNGRLFVCGFNFDEADACARWLKSEIISYVKSDLFHPKHTLDEKQIHNLLNANSEIIEANKNIAFNENDKAAKRKART